MTTFIRVLIIYILITFGGVSAEADEAFEHYIDLGIIPYETQIPWSADHYIERPSEEIVEEVITQEPTTNTIVSGDMGTLVIDGILEVGISNGVLYTENGPSNITQQIVDDPNLACIWTSEATYIADHNNQHFSRLFNVQVGSTATFNGRQVTCILVDPNGYADPWIHLSDGSYASDHGPVIMYTCNGNGRLVTVWQ